MMQKGFFIELKQNSYTTDVTVLPPSFNLKLLIEFLTHFYSRKCEMKLGSGKEPHPSRVPNIGPSKRLND
jgi:hypothetical protein